MADLYEYYGMRAPGNPDFAWRFRGSKAYYDSLIDELGLINEETLMGFAYPVTVTDKHNKKGVDPFSTLHVMIQESTAGADGIKQSKKIKIKCNPDNATAAVKSLKGRTLNIGDNDSASTKAWVVMSTAVC